MSNRLPVGFAALWRMARQTESLPCVQSITALNRILKISGQTVLSEICGVRKKFYRLKFFRAIEEK
jgi:hypothetical protein